MINKVLLFVILSSISILNKSCTDLSLATLVGSYTGELTSSNCPSNLGGDLVGYQMNVIIAEYSDDFIEIQVNNGSPKRAKLKENDIYYGFDYVEQIYNDNSGNEFTLFGNGFYSADGLTINFSYRDDSGNSCTNIIKAQKDE
jgi:hypothetical protein